jgi:hypothetical protein
MDFLSFFLSVTVAHLRMCFYYNNSKQTNVSLSITESNSNNAPQLLKATVDQKNDGLINNIDKRLGDNILTLKRNLKHLEFINYLESQIYNEAPEKMSVDFLYEFNAIKQDVQIKTIEISQRLT